MKYLFRNTDYKGNSIAVEVEEETLPELMAYFRQFLLGVGFSEGAVDEHIPPR